MEKHAAACSARPSGKYCNDIRVGYNAYEFVLDFSQEYEERGSAGPHTRIVTPPPHAKAFAELLLKSLAQYEQHFGPIETKIDSPKSGGADSQANRPSRRSQ